MQFKKKKKRKADLKIGTIQAELPQNIFDKKEQIENSDLRVCDENAYEWFLFSLGWN